MRTTLTIDDDVLMIARGLAERDDRTIGDVISDLARQALRAPRDQYAFETRNGVPLVPVKKGSLPVTTELVNRLRDEMP
ncbi:CopG family transcriptional regulator [Mesorhizobium australicum]|uniref:CopG family transcriptional regulator n=1 Tax=Mesorhizobium australicum TaxID=536018 RepID=A0A1X7PG62_9HYPH|nr:CopG family transcriptional regulator [Mesorhizobium australicum]SMH50224.1 hypothetical protein SAMN02982922_4111 [Mesorhizobium australicum]